MSISKIWRAEKIKKIIFFVAAMDPLFWLNLTGAAYLIIAG